ncbi:sulfite exporter TauE/SafE family protein [Aestuariibius sp. 2305UL40-4]|uniref:sulfite exporter TauE/SafE family protein n=1 Tax=Aestuariibius violaceus TaxID=3234132 RepID=UPI00345E72BE
MPEGLSAALALPGLWAVLGAVTVAGVVYGFAGFGAALIFTPIAVAFIAPETAIAAFALSALVSVFTVVPSAWGEADRRAAGTMIAAAILAAPLGVLGLSVLDREVIRTIVAIIVAITLAALIAGWRFSAPPTLASRAGIGAGAGVMGGMTGLNGPIVILFQLAGSDGARRARANLILFLTATSISFLPLLWMQGLLTVEALWLGLILMPLYAVGTRVGKALFTPGREPIYRGVAYVIIGLAALAALPVWD